MSLVPGAVPEGRFAQDGDAWRYEGALVLDNAARVLAEADSLPLPASGVVDFAALERADSVALAVIMALRRRATAEGRALSVRNLPAGLSSLALAYGVVELVHDDA